MTNFEELSIPSPLTDKDLVVKVCDTSDLGIELSARNENKILQLLNSPNISQYIAFYEDKILNKSYLVLENAGNKNLTDFIEERQAKAKELKKGQPRPLGEELIREIMG